MQGNAQVAVSGTDPQALKTIEKLSLAAEPAGAVNVRDLDGQYVART